MVVTELCSILKCLLITAMVCCSPGQCAQLENRPSLARRDYAQLRVKRTPVTVKNASILTTWDKQDVVLVHDIARSNVTPPAANMQTMEWDEQLGKSAETYSRRCLFVHSKGLKTSNFSSIGESLYIDWLQRSPAKAVAAAVLYWMKETYFYSYDTNVCQTGKACGHYTQVVWAKTYAVGCGVTTCNNIDIFGSVWPVGQLVVCQYGPPGNYAGVKPYVNGPACSICSSSKPYCSNNLCSATNGSTSSNSTLVYHGVKHYVNGTHCSNCSSARRHCSTSSCSNSGIRQQSLADHRSIAFFVLVCMILAAMLTKPSIPLGTRTGDV